MKILSQLMNALPDATGKPSTADVSKGSLQSSFASVIGAAAAAATTNGDTKLSRAQNVETKKTSSPESAKKSTSSSSVDTSSAQLVAGASVPLTVVVPVVPQSAVQPENETPAKESFVSTDAPVVSKSSLAAAGSTIGGTGTLDVTKPAATVTMPKIATGGVQESSSVSKVDTAAADTVAATVPSVESASTHTATEISPKISVATAPETTSEPAYVAPVSAAPVEAATAIPSNRVTQFDGIANGTKNLDSTAGDAASAETAMPDAVDSGIANSNPTKADATSAKVDGGITLNPAVFQVQMPVPVVVPAPASAQSPIDGQTPAATTGATDAVAASKSAIASGVVKQGGASVASTLPVDRPVAVAAPKPSSEPVSTQHVQASVPATNTSTESKAATPTTETDAASATQPVEASVAAVTPQAETVAVAAPQQVMVQSATGVQSSASTFKVADGKSEPTGTSNLASVGLKSRASASDWRLNRNTSSASGDKASSTDTDGAAIATRVVTPEAGAKEVASNLKGALESTTLAQGAQTAQSAGQITPAPAVSAPTAATHDSGAAANTALPVPATSAESTQAAHALSSAQLIQSVHGSEMRLGMNSAEFGNISINTSLNHQTLSAQISMDHSALGSALAMHLPAIEEKLGTAYGLQAKVELHDNGANSTASDSSSNQSSGDRRSQGGSNGTSTAAIQGSISALTSSNFTSSSSSTSMAAGTSRLDIRI